MRLRLFRVERAAAQARGAMPARACTVWSVDVGEEEECGEMEQEEEDDGPCRV